MSYPVHRYERQALVAYFALTFAITWGIAAFILLRPSLVEALFGKMSSSNPVFIVAVAGPTMAATVVTFTCSGWSGPRALYSRIIQWRFGIRWYAILLVGLPIICLVTSRVTGSRPSGALYSPTLFLGLLLNQLLLGPLGEELGWRGFALPRLLRRLNPLVASLLLGTIWGIWHLPAFFVSGLPQSGVSIPLFLFGALCMSILATWIFQHTSGSVLSVVLFHYIANVSTSLFATPFPAFTLAMAIAACLVLIMDRRVGWLRLSAAPGAQTSPAYETLAVRK
jgi:membrane protease YdiL (CAAX protease family)